MTFNFDFIKEFSKGLLIGLLYLETTKANDTTFTNILLFGFFYCIMAFSATYLDVEPHVITNGFITKTIFTLVDERIRK